MQNLDIFKGQKQAEEKVNQIQMLSKLIDYPEFIVGAMRVAKLHLECLILQSFQSIYNGDGFISKEELKEAMGFLEPEIWEQFLNDCDLKQKDGKISEDEFSKFLTTL
ncbi:unnamed protein product (macronuclear) [Paramecium tetraurelia]|uniref:EF-hand domain-containing protein n=1 Tax=Paramecium tetraurelia TaxID=5888 RepID=A0BEA0_PARTE|nr:uncharacterized protein GSPATT00027900001 [Paramecium tetraurelia]CAK56867.1 unnamed protein product [Paramecium tetraurelia]|eukprot:XP_001424265.1 hypothetical protein (macronuclear) [Paramecium tetraurelia strain d4-2]